MQFTTADAPPRLVQDNFDDINPKDFIEQEPKSKRPRTADILLEEQLPQGLLKAAEAADLAGDFFSVKPESDHEQLPEGIEETAEEKQKHWFVGSVDQGTTSTRFLIFNGHGEPIVSHQIEFENHYPNSGWHEHDPMTLLEVTISRISAPSASQINVRLLSSGTILLASPFTTPLSGQILALLL
ncbi:hypothetical protein AU210_009396 [Fusarium oxysporum f. sp. radicis-cucumerinum]|uniref:Carbohydrate kinase FGGY N-terminal domain-containing protein n=1 Tax=Fusarium oxysporum f. sp. radicis-cucumerinum TaxID=327505 RepID=A0A2H3H8T5_FUSOX|nr:hypothetical protein AU210_009396 [Fusarium oxysporum f. sp. radicis-cucumerinum]